ncbi:unnamed protein product [Rotaria sordida]|uniref:Death domain-containing protein n=1 Tax=Rotaria sordida TaxID=392033 RepID=A0A813YXS5_9BILA|nr:unnamed protein product [Rotaria sordida]
MDEFIRQLTHDNQLFKDQWPNIYDQVRKMFNEYEEKHSDIINFKVKVLDVLVDYALAESTNDSEPIDVKIVFIEHTVKLLVDDPLPSLTDLVRILRRILDTNNIFHKWHLACIKTFYYKFKLGERLSSTKSIDLIESIFQSFQKHSFLNGETDKQTQEKWKEFLSRQMFSSLSMDTNVLSREETMLTMRPAYQQFFKYAARMSHQSQVWSGVVSTLTRTLPTLFDEYSNASDAQADLVECVKQPISSDFLDLLVKSYKKNAHLFKMNSSEFSTVIEKLLLFDQIEKAYNFIDSVIIVHIDSAMDIMDSLIRMFIRTCPIVNINSRNELCKRVISSLVYKLGRVKCNKKFAPLFFDFVLIILDLCVLEAPQCAWRLLEKADFYPWKELAPKFKDFVRLCAAYDKLNETNYFSDLDTLENILRLAVDRAKVNNIIFRSTHDEALKAILRWSAAPTENSSKKSWDTHVYRMGRPMAELIDQKQVTMEICSQFIKVLEQRVIDNEDDDSKETTSPMMASFFISLATQLGKYIEILKNFPQEIHRQLASLILTALKRPYQNENGQMSLEHIIAMNLWFKIAQCLKDEADVRLYESCIKEIHSLACDNDEKTFFDWWNAFWFIVGMKIPDAAADYVEDFLNDLLDRKQINMISLLPTFYPKRPDPYHARLDELIDSMFSGDIGHVSLLGNLFYVIAKEHPELITEDHVNNIFGSLNDHKGTSQELYLIFQGLGVVANAQPHLFHKHYTTLLRFIVELQNISAFTCLQQYFVASTIVDGEQRANESLTFLIDLLKRGSGITNDIRKQIFHACQLIGVINKQALETKRKDLEAFNSFPECRTLIDFIDGNKMSEENQAAINRTREEIVQMEKRVVKTEKDVHHITNVVKRQELKMLQCQYEQQKTSSALTDLTTSSQNNPRTNDAAIAWIDRIELSLDRIFLELQTVTNLGAHVDSVDTRLNDVTEQVQIQAREIERIDAKTLSYVPAEWGSQVTKLLNHRANNDWRLLGKRFGYSTSELRHWALQADPSMSLLNEWFMTHKTDEATYGLVKMLDEIGRQDVTKIIRDAISAAGQLIPDDMPIEIKRLPPIFLSYQWESQKAVLTLKTHLEEAGYACWMDIGQMGGGDKLFAKIDAGIRGAKVVICCMNSAYNQSDNCLREVHLCVNTGKPIIPLQMEKQTWPPEGALGPIMSEYLYIRFYDRKSNSDNYWPADKFTELLGQIRYHIAPDPDMISERYSNWFVPRVDNLIFLQPTSNDNKNKQVELKDDTPLVVTHPQVMISYQWDRQTDIVALYKRLTQLGYRCWLDIFQMGGGDSLFEKIDAGIRNAKCVLACVTPKYIKSINCRREMSLADALTKPIVSLLLEDTTTWPPAGPMALVFTEKPYIDFRHQNENIPDGQDIWSLKQFEQVLARLKIAVPEVQTEKPRKHLLDMKRPTTALGHVEHKNRPARIRSAPSVPQSRACSIM